MKVDDILDDLATVKIDGLAVDLVGVKPLVKVTGAVIDDNDVETLLLKIIGEHDADVVVFCRAFHALRAAAVLVGIGGNPATMDIDKPVIAFALVEIGVGGLFAIAAQRIRRCCLAQFRAGIAGQAHHQNSCCQGRELLCPICVVSDHHVLHTIYNAGNAQGSPVPGHMIGCAGWLFKFEKCKVSTVMLSTC